MANKPKNVANSEATKTQETETPAIEPIWSAEEVLSHSTAADAAKHSITVVIPWLVFIAIFHHKWNPGKRGKEDHLALYPNIMAVGIIKPITVSCRIALKAFETLLEKSDVAGMIKVLWALTGHLRQTCTTIAETKDPKVWEKRWSKGVQVDLIFNLDQGQEYFLACDHDTVARSRPAMIEQIINLFKIGRSHKAIMLELWDEFKGPFNQVSSKSAKAISEATTDHERIEAMYGVRRGILQDMGYFALNLPVECLQAYMRDERGETSGPRLVLSDAKDLYKANKGGNQKMPTAELMRVLKKKYAAYGTKKESKTRTVKEMETLFGRMGSDSGEVFDLWYHKKLDIDLAGEWDSQLCDAEGAGIIKLPEFEQAKESRITKAKAAAKKAAKPNAA